jgi:hypothetical protein
VIGHVVGLFDWKALWQGLDNTKDMIDDFTNVMGCFFGLDEMVGIWILFLHRSVAPLVSFCFCCLFSIAFWIFSASRRQAVKNSQIVV